MPAAAVLIRQRQAADDAFIEELGASAFGEYSQSAAQVTASMARSDRTLIAVRGETPIGLAVVVHNSEGFAYLKAIAVVEQERGRGIGRLLLESVEHEARALGAVGLRLHTAEANVAALELFLKRGYRIARRLPRYYVGTYHACELVKNWLT